MSAYPQDVIDNVINRDWIVLVDASLSMNTPDCPGGSSRWAFVKEVVGLIATIASKYDPDGIDMMLFGGANPTLHNSVNIETLGSMMPDSPTEMSTYTGKALDKVFHDYFAAGGSKPMGVIVLTDGQASDRLVVEQALRNLASAAGDGETVGVGFWQIGRDGAAAKDLEYYDNSLGEIDVVDTVQMDELMSNLSSLEQLMARIILD